MKIKNNFLHLISFVLASLLFLFSGVSFGNQKKASASEAAVSSVELNDDLVEEFVDGVFTELAAKRDTEEIISLELYPILFVDNTFCPELLECETTLQVYEAMTQSCFFQCLFEYFPSPSWCDSNLTADPFAQNAVADPLYDRSWIFIPWVNDGEYLGFSNYYMYLFDFTEPENQNAILGCYERVFAITSWGITPHLYSFLHELQGCDQLEPYNTVPVFVLTDELIPYSPDGLRLIYAEVLSSTEISEFMYEYWITYDL